MKVQFSIAGVMAFTLFVSLGLWSALYANFVFAHVATTSLLAGGVVGWLVGLRYGQGERGCIAGVIGALPWTCLAALVDLQAWSQAHRFQAWGWLAVIAALGAVPMASAVAVYDRSPKVLVLHPIVNCFLAVLVPGVVLMIGMTVAVLLFVPRNQWGGSPPWIVVSFSLPLTMICFLAALVGGTYGVAALLLRSFESLGREYRNERPWEIQPSCRHHQQQGYSYRRA